MCTFVYAAQGTMLLMEVYLHVWQVSTNRSPGACYHFLATLTWKIVVCNKKLEGGLTWNTS